MPTTRQRDIPGPEGQGGSLFVSYAGNVQQNVVLSKQPVGGVGEQVTVSENHPGWRRRKPGSASGDLGGDFYSIKRWTTYQGGRADVEYDYALFGRPKVVKYHGPILPFSGPPPWPPDVSGSKSFLMAKGTQAIKASSPTNSTADLVQILAEIRRDGLPKLVGAETLAADTRKRYRKALGNEYLNVEFGFKPLADDMVSVAMAITRGDAIMRQYLRDAGRVVRRRYDFPSVQTTDYSVFADRTDPIVFWSDGIIDPGPGLQGSVIRRRETTIKRWFSGAFMYFLPDDIAYSARKGLSVTHLKKLLGVDLTPETLWNLAPWSWAADWFAPIGDLIGNLTDAAEDSLVLKYGYIMEHSIVRDTYTWSGPTGLMEGLIPGVWTATTEVKIRHKASPYGFGLSWDGFSPRQLSILSALGLSKG